jgi:2-polyprenyl-6-hydroxyphenyl methylase/3-demethylubiquinone-9 3-methyltransferase
MPRAQRRPFPTDPIRPHSSVDTQEVAKFSALAEEWWNPLGEFAPLHRLNPLRLGFIRDTAARHFARDTFALLPFAGLSLVDIGCGGGLLTEPMARQGFTAFGIDASEESVAIATAHARTTNVAASYRCAVVETLAEEGSTFDIVLNMEVVEHVTNVPAFLASCATILKPGGLMIVATINRTLKAFALAKLGAEYILGWIPRGTHDWRKFVGPPRLRAELEEAGLEVLKIQGVAFDPLAWNWRLSPDTDVNYMVVAAKASKPA